MIPGYGYSTNIGVIRGSCRRALLAVRFSVAGVIVFSLVGFGGCAVSGRVESRGGLQSVFVDKEDTWTIMCKQFCGDRRQVDADRLALQLKSAPGIVPVRVHVHNGRKVSYVCYGQYYRTADRETGHYDIPPELRDDKAAILMQGGMGLSLDARVIPYPTPDVGKDEWELDNNPGAYTLRVAIFYREPGFRGRKKAAAAYCGELRRKGYEAYYRHGELTSEVFVGSFGEDAQIPRRKYGVLFYEPSPAVQELQNKETFQCELWNMKVRSSKQGEGRVVVPSKLVSVRREMGYPQEF